jgi:hypothetical protein
MNIYLVIIALNVACAQQMPKEKNVLFKPTAPTEEKVEERQINRQIMSLIVGNLSFNQIPLVRPVCLMRAALMISYVQVLHPKDTLVVSVIASLYEIVDVDQRNNLATISVYFDIVRCK